MWPCWCMGQQWLGRQVADVQQAAVVAIVPCYHTWDSNKRQQLPTERLSSRVAEGQSINASCPLRLQAGRALGYGRRMRDISRQMPLASDAGPEWTFFPLQQALFGQWEAILAAGPPPC